MELSRNSRFKSKQVTSTKNQVKSSGFVTGTLGSSSLFQNARSGKRSLMFWQQAPPLTSASENIWLSERMMKRLLGAVAVATLLMTIPQIYTIWVDQQTAGISLWSWITYWIGSLVWLVYGLQKRDWIIYLPCAAWLLIDSAVVAGVLVYG